VTEFIELPDDEKRSLEYKIRDILDSEGIQNTGLEVKILLKYGDGSYKASYVFETSKGKDAYAAIYFKADFGCGACTDFKELP